MYQKFLLPKNSQNFQNLAYFGEKDRSLEKNDLKLSETPNFASWFSNTSRTLLLLMRFEDVQRFRFFGKRCFFSKEHLKVFRITKHWYFPLECLSKVFVAYAIFKRSKFEFFRKKDVFCEKILERFQEQYLAFFIGIACQTLTLLRNFQNNRILGLFGEIDVVFEKILFFPQKR